MTPEKTRKTIWIISLIALGISLLCPTYCTSARCSGYGTGFVDLFLGWFGALFMGSTYFAWLANPFFIASIFTNKKTPLLSLIFSTIGLIIALSFLRGGKVMLNEAGHMGYITKLQVGYWLWVSSISLMVIASIISLISRMKKTEK